MAELDLFASYDAYPRIEKAFRAALDESLEPRGPESLSELVGGLELPEATTVVDVGCGEGDHTLALARRFGFCTLGIDPVPRHIDLARHALDAEAVDARFVIGAAEALPVRSASVGLIWCREVLVHLPTVERAFAEFRRVLRAGGRALVYQVFITDRLEGHDADKFCRALGIVADSASPRRVEAAIVAEGLRIDECIVFGGEWGERAEERNGAGTRRLLHAARLLRTPARYIEQFGEEAYNVMLNDCLWHVYRMIGKLSGRAYLLSRPH